MCGIVFCIGTSVKVIPRVTFDPGVAVGAKTTMKIRLVGATIAMMLLLLFVTMSTKFLVTTTKPKALGSNTFCVPCRIGKSAV